MTEGFVEGDEVECVLHQGRFDLAAGLALCFPLTKAIRTYATRVKDGQVLVDLTRGADGAPHADDAD